MRKREKKRERERERVKGRIYAYLLHRNRERKSRDWPAQQRAIHC
jgi:hypothetical protein